MEFNIFDHINTSSAVSANDGDIVYIALNELITNNPNEKIIINFSNITDLTTAFLNNSIGKLFYTHDTSKLMQTIKFTGLQNVTQENLLKLSIFNAIESK